MQKHQLTPRKYIMTKARNLPFGECLISEDFTESGMAILYISRIMPSGKQIIGVYMVDIFCLGVKDTLYKFGIDIQEATQFKEDIGEHQTMVPYDLHDAHNLIYGAIDFAEELGFQPHEDFKLTEYLLDTEYITDGIDDMEFGKDGNPFYIAGPDDHVQRILSTLRNNVGERNFDFVMPGEEE